MAKKNKKNNGVQSNNVNIVLPESLSTDEMQKIIVNALLAAEEAKVQKAKQQKEEEHKRFQEAMGYKDYSKCKGLKKQIQVFLNRLKMLKKLLFAPKHLIQGDSATFGLLRIFIEMFFWLAKELTMLFTIATVIYIPLQFITDRIPVLPAVENVLLVVYALASFLLSRMFRMASIEVNKIEDKNLLFGIFTSITSIVSIVVAVIAIVELRCY